MKVKLLLIKDGSLLLNDVDEYIDVPDGLSDREIRAFISGYFKLAFKNVGYRPRDEAEALKYLSTIPQPIVDDHVSFDKYLKEVNECAGTVEIIKGIKYEYFDDNGNKIKLSEPDKYPLGCSTNNCTVI